MKWLSLSGNLIAPGLYPSEMTEGSMKSLEKDVPDNGHGAFAGAHKMPSDRCPAGKNLSPARSCLGRFVLFDRISERKLELIVLDRANWIRTRFCRDHSVHDKPSWSISQR